MELGQFRGLRVASSLGFQRILGFWRCWLGPRGCHGFSRFQGFRVQGSRFRL